MFYFDGNSLVKVIQKYQRGFKSHYNLNAVYESNVFSDPTIHKHVSASKYNKIQHTI